MSARGAAVLQVTHLPGSHGFECGGCPAPGPGIQPCSRGGGGAELVCLQLPVAEAELGDLRAAHDSAVEDEGEQIVPRVMRRDPLDAEQALRRCVDAKFLPEFPLDG